MKIGFLICVMMLTVSATPRAVEPQTFEKATIVGEGDKRSFYLFSTSTATYIIRQDGMGEVAMNGRRRVFYLRLGMARRLEQVYFYEYQGDVVLLYEVSDGRAGLGYLARLNPQSRKVRWLTPVKGNDLGPCTVEGNEAHCGAVDALTKIDLNTGASVETTMSTY